MQTFKQFLTDSKDKRSLINTTAYLRVTITVKVDGEELVLPVGNLEGVVQNQDGTYTLYRFSKAQNKDIAVGEYPANYFKGYS